MALSQHRTCLAIQADGRVHVPFFWTTAATGVNRDQGLDAIEFILQHNLPLSIEQMRNPAFSLINYVQVEA
jgi:hypothetical protein